MAIEDRGPSLQAVCLTLMTTATLTTLLRMYTRLFIVRKFGFDDFAMVLALIFFILFVVCAMIGVHFGTGRHWWDLEQVDNQLAMKYWWFCYLWYCCTMIASKISIGYFLLRITVRRIDELIIWGVMAVTVLTGIVFFFVTLFQCSPVDFFWDKDLAEGTCLDIQVIIALTYLYSAFSVVCDFTFAILPMFLIWRLNMDKRSKIALFPIMAMACVASAAVVVRFAYVKDFKSPDFLYATIDIAIWSTTEQGLAITAGSLATLRPLLQLILRTLGFSPFASEQLPDTDDRSPSTPGLRTIGQRSDQRRQRGPFSLTTFMRRDDNDADAGESGMSGSTNEDLHKGGSSTRAVRVPRDWNSSLSLDRGGNGSEERIVSSAPAQETEDQEMNYKSAGALEGRSRH